ncbi:PRD domain-containing protein [Vagococcus coleopterorum]|uniref:PRD domain-containing protein n=1 Tax=Vagococcus coleopterorum TaxID=2714946 RepID=A0A6G8APC7_9ENTE|nr:PRD domain-containing protein [Vagococcus coleopterorum]QIL46830.1 PRD domain-containing protein [Vagococcus coleopterorum]
MLIERVVNNNVVFSRDAEGQEIIVSGRGISFNKKVGLEIDPDRVEKIFVTKDFENDSRMEAILKEIPIDYFEISNSIISFAEESLNKKLHESIYLSLSDHIYTTVSRFKEGLCLKNPMLWDIKRFYPEEFKVGKEALAIIYKKLAISLPIDEAGFISLHLVNASMDEDLETVYELTNLMQEISNIVKYHFQMDFDMESIYYHRFVTHLKFFALRLTTNKKAAANNESELLEIIKCKYINAYACVEKISEYLQNNYHYTVSDDEKLYLTIHIERLIYKTELD